MINRTNGMWDFPLFDIYTANKREKDAAIQWSRTNRSMSTLEGKKKFSWCQESRLLVFHQTTREKQNSKHIEKASEKILKFTFFNFHDLCINHGLHSLNAFFVHIKLRLHLFFILFGNFFYSERNTLLSFLWNAKT